MKYNDDQRALWLFCWINGQRLTEMAKIIGVPSGTLNIQIAKFIEKYTGRHLVWEGHIYNERRKRLGRLALGRYRKKEHRLGYGQLPTPRGD